MLDRNRPGSAKFNANCGTASAYLKFMVKNASTAVRAKYTPPGQKTRLQRNEKGEWKQRLPTLSLETSLTDKENGDGLPICETIPDDLALSYYERVEEHALAEWLLNWASTTSDTYVASALSYIYFEGLDLTAAANRMRIHIFTLRRRIDRWVDCQQLRAA